MNRNTLALIISGNIVIIIQVSIFFSEQLLDYSYNKTGMIIIGLVLYLLILICIHLITKYFKIINEKVEIISDKINNDYVSNDYISSISDIEKHPYWIDMKSNIIKILNDNNWSGSVDHAVELLENNNLYRSHLVNSILIDIKIHKGDIK